MTHLSSPQVDAEIEELGEGRRRVTLLPRDPALFVPVTTCVTRYPVALLRSMFGAGAPAYMCAAIVREEDDRYLRLGLRNYLLSYVDEHEFDDARVLDFGCGGGFSTAVLAALFPTAQIVGLGHDERLLELAGDLTRHLGHENVSLVSASSRSHLPPELGTFDHVVLSGVYEHLLPGERRAVMPELWASLRPGGVLFVNQTPNRLYPLEAHSTNLPVVNYLPAPLAARFVRRFSRRVGPDDSWQELLRGGVRGATRGEILSRLGAETPPTLLRPTRLGGRDEADIWYRVSMVRNPRKVRGVFREVFRFGRRLGVGELVPILHIAIRKV